MKSIITFLLFTLSCLNLFGQEKKDFGENTGYVYIKVNGVHPDSLLIEDDDIILKMDWIGGNSVNPEITNKTKEMMYIDYNSSYFVIQGNTSDMVPGKTYVKDKNAEVKNDKIAPGAKLSPSLVSPGNAGSITLFSSSAARKVYKATGKPAIEKMTLILLKEDGSKITKEFEFEVMSTFDVEKIVNAAKKEAKRKK